jgi:hypothetical protein
LSEKPILVGGAAKEFGKWARNFGLIYFKRLPIEARKNNIRNLAYTIHKDPELFIQQFFGEARQVTLRHLDRLIDIIAMEPYDFLEGLGNNCKDFARAWGRHQFDFYERLKVKLERSRGHAEDMLLYKLTGVNPHRDNQPAPAQRSK